jgi:hypothetical protein
MSLPEDIQVNTQMSYVGGEARLACRASCIKAKPLPKR